MNFSQKEFDCHCNLKTCQWTLVDTDLVLGLEKLREKREKPIHLTSGFRCLEHNHSIGGKPGSTHTVGKAADIREDGVSGHDLAIAASTIETFALGGIGEYKSFAHVDVRGYKSRWKG